MSTSPTAKLLRLGRDCADQRFSASRVGSVDATMSYADTRALFKSSTSQATTARLLGKHSQFLFASADLSVQVLSDVSPSPTDPDQLIGMLGDHLFDAVPVTLDAALFDGFAAVLASPADATAFELPASSTDMDQLEGPPNGQGAREPGSIARLQFDAGGQAPLAVALRAFFPVPPGVAIPSALRLDARHDEFAAACPIFEPWRCGTLNAIQHNAGKSITTGVVLVVGTEVDTAGFGQRPILDEVCPTMTPLLPSSSRAQQARGSWATIRDGAHMRMGLQHPEAAADPPQNNGGGGGGAIDYVRMSTAFGNALKDSTSSLKDKDTLEAAQDRAATIQPAACLPCYQRGHRPAGGVPSTPYRRGRETPQDDSWACSGRKQEAVRGVPHVAAVEGGYAPDLQRQHYFRRR